MMDFLQFAAGAIPPLFLFGSDFFIFFEKELDFKFVYAIFKCIAK